MRAVVYERYGAPELRDIEAPGVPDDGMLVRVRAASLNPLDWYFLMGKPYLGRLATGLAKPKRTVPGVDFAGTVESVGKNAKQFRPGDEVFGAGRGALAEYVRVAESRVALKPAHVTFEQAAAVPVAALTALQGLRDYGRIQPGQQVLINGASGGVGTFAVQIAKSFGAEVTGVCSTGNVDQARALGADTVIDYTREDFTRSGRRYDLMFDIAGSRGWSECKRVLGAEAKLVVAGGPRTNRWIGPLAHFFRIGVASMRGGRRAAMFVARMNQQDLTVLKALLEAGKVTPVIDMRYALSEVASAFRYLGEGHARGKIVVTV